METKFSRRRFCLAATLACLLSMFTNSFAQGQSAQDQIATKQGPAQVVPINHATFGVSWNKKWILIDPVGGGQKYTNFPAKPDLILVTDIHGDHMNADTLKALLETNKTRIVAPEAVKAQLPDDLKKVVTVLANGDKKEVAGAMIEAVPMYNLTEDRLKFHARGRGNGYILTLGETRFYISGDTEDIPEMRQLKDIDVAFVCMNLPYTMTVDQAASAVNEFQPKIVYPYHHRGSDVKKFKELLGSNKNIDVRLRDWYKN
ncbi:MAG: MBL fold metallo-hydrolase [Verrucomicrobiales bacterium]